MLCKRKQNFPFTPNHLIVGSFYGKISEVDLKIDPGKMMGLAPYGSDKFPIEDYVDKVLNFEGSCPVTYNNVINFNNTLINYFIDQAKQKKINTKFLGDSENILSEINVNIAHSTQKLAEKCILNGVNNLYSCMENMGIKTNNLCAAGGLFLNCPANSKIINESKFSNLFLPPMINDSGMSVGSSLALYHNFFR